MQGLIKDLEGVEYNFKLIIHLENSSTISNTLTGDEKLRLEHSLKSKHKERGFVIEASNSDIFVPYDKINYVVFEKL